MLHDMHGAAAEAPKCWNIFFYITEKQQWRALRWGSEGCLQP
jgi:hypothetical protein